MNSSSRRQPGRIPGHDSVAASNVRAAKIDRLSKSVNFVRRRIRRLGSALAFATLAVGCGGSAGNPAPLDAGAYWPTYLGNAARTPFLGERISEAPPQVLWTITLGSVLAGAPIATENVIVAASRDRYIYTINREDGSEFWRKKLDGPPAPPVLAGRTIYTATEGRGTLRILDLESGDDIWKQEFPSVRQPLSLAGDTLFVATDFGTLFALDVRKQLEIWSLHFSQPPVGGPVIVDDFILYLTIDSIHALTRRLGIRRAVAHSDEILIGELASTDSMAYATTESGSIRAWSLPDLVPTWSASGFARFLSGPVIAGDRGYAISSVGQLISFDPRDGTARIIAKLPGSYRASPTIVQNGILVGSLDGHLYFYDRQGQQLWDVKLEGTIEEPIAVQNGRMLVALYGSVQGALGIDQFRGRLMELR